ncbi:MAG: hypothetical protein ACRD0K_17820 [Egibacteraceae bacterium]
MTSIDDRNQLTVSVSIDDAAQALLRAGSNSLAVAEAYEIDSPEMAQSASLELANLSTTAARLKALEDYLLEPAKLMVERIKNVVQPARKAVASADTMIRGRLSDYMKRQQEQAEAARRAQEEVARKAQAAAAAAAAAARAEAEVRAAAEREKVARALAALEAAQAAGKKSEMARLSAQAAAAQERAQAAVEAGEAKANEAVMEAAAATVAAPVVVSKVSGAGLRDKWEAERTAATDHEAIRAIAVHMVMHARPDLVAYLKLDESALNKSAAAQKTAFDVPGFKAVNNQVLARSGGKK